MSVRPSMLPLIQLVRDLIADPATTTQAFDDLAIQNELDQHRLRVHAKLNAFEQIGPGNLWEYKIHQADEGFWEEGALLQTYDGTVLTSTESQPMIGEWVFGASHYHVYITGCRYDVYGTAISLLNRWIAKLKGKVDFSTGGDIFNFRQKVSNLQLLIEQYNAIRPPVVGEMVRNDVSLRVD